MKRFGKQYIISEISIFFDYDCSDIEYKNFHTNIKLTCKKHGVFQQTPKNLIRHNIGCPHCLTKITEKNFIEKCKAIHDVDVYDYSKVNYKNSITKVEIICKLHGVFKQTLNNHIHSKHGCPICAGTKKLTLDKFIEKCKDVHGDLYDYSKVNYKNSTTKVEIQCKLHGSFFQHGQSHINKKTGCPKCNSSKGELQIIQYLESKNISYIKEKRFEDCRNIKPLPFDFYLEDYNMCIEYDGIQHFTEVQVFGGEEAFEKIQRNDSIKTNYCIDNSIKLIRIKYNQNIKDILNEFKI